MNSKKPIFAILFSIALALLAGCPGSLPGETDKSLEFGDSALVDYIVEVEGFNATANETQCIVYDASMESVAKAAGIYNPNRTYAPLSVEMDNSKTGTLPFRSTNVGLALIRALIGMKEGENATFVLKPEEAYGPYDSGRVFSLEKFYNMSRYEEVPVYYFEMNNISYEPGSQLSSSAFDAEAVNYTNGTVTIKYLAKENKTFVYNGLPQKVVSLDEESMGIELLAEAGKTYTTRSPKGQPVAVRATAVNETHVTFDGNAPLAGKTLKFTLFVKRIQKSSS